MTQPAADTETTLIAIAGASRASAWRSGGGRRPGVYAAASLSAIALGFGAYFLLHGPGEAPVPDAQAHGEGSPHPAVPVEAAKPAAGPDELIELAEERAAPADARATPAAERAKPAVARAKPAVARPRPAAPAFGFLALTARPECEIHVDGRATGARTPIRDLKLPAGKHRITLLDREHGIQDSFTVVIGAGVTERVARDYSGQLERDQRDQTINPFANGGR